MSYRPIRFVFPVVFLMMTGVAGSGVQDLGRLSFPNSGSPQAQDAFIRGVLLLHSFEYEDAREAFVEAGKIDPSFAMAFWGEAMTHNHPLWRERDRTAALEALGRFAPPPEARAAKTPTERERGFMRAVDVLYRDDDKAKCDLDYEREMARLAERFPGDDEAAAFHSLSILGTADGERDFRVYMRAAAVAEEVFARNPEHPGAAHYLIHSYDDPVHAPLGLRPARVYARIAPAASHAQHMISHIYMALGAWDESVTANEKAFAVSEERAKRKGLPVYRRSHHALDWLAYAYLQQGRLRDARARLEVMESDAKASPTRNSLWYAAHMRADHIVHMLPGGEVPPTIESVAGAGVSASSVDGFATGLALVRAGKTREAGAVLAEMKRRREEAKDGKGDETPRELTEAVIMEKELDALIREADGRRGEALALLEEATALEDSLAFDFGPPTVVKPSHELYGEMLLAARRPADAALQFARSLDRAPRRTLSLLGLARASAGSGDSVVAENAYRELASILGRADAGLPWLGEARKAAAR